MKLQYSNLNNKLIGFFLKLLVSFGVKTRHANCSSTPSITLRFSGDGLCFYFVEFGAAKTSIGTWNLFKSKANYGAKILT